MTISISTGAAAYANAAKQLSGTAPAADAVKGTGSGFGDLLQSALNGAVDTLHKGESQSLAAVTGKADLTNVVTAVNNADLTLQTVLAVRDKVISAYTEIMHMAL